MVLLWMGHDMAWCYCYCGKYSNKSSCKFIYWNSNFYVHYLGGASLNKIVLHILTIIIVGAVTALIVPPIDRTLGDYPRFNVNSCCFSFYGIQGGESGLMKEKLKDAFKNALALFTIWVAIIAIGAVLVFLIGLVALLDLPILTFLVSLVGLFLFIFLTMFIIEYIADTFFG